MSIITKAGSPVKGSPTQFTLNKSALAAVTVVAADAYFSDSTNWKEVILLYKSSTGRQKEIIKFDATLASPTANFAVSLKARDVFEIYKIIIKDFDNGSLEISRSQLTAADFDVDMGALGPVSLTWSSDLAPSTYASTATSIEKLTGTGWNFNVISNQTLSGDMFIEARVAAYPNNMIIGFQNTSANSSSQSVVLGAINYGLYCDPGQGLVFYTKSSLSYNMQPVSSVSMNDIIKISISGGATGTISIYKNSILVYTTSVPSVTVFGIPYSAPYRVGITMYESGCKFDNISFGNI